MHQRRQRFVFLLFWQVAPLRWDTGCRQKNCELALDRVLHGREVGVRSEVQADARRCRSHQMEEWLAAPEMECVEVFPLQLL
jgi:hypothetical protein